MKYYRSIVMSLILFSGSISIGCEIFSYIPGVSEVTRDIPSQFQCSRLGFVELNEFAEDYLLDDKIFFITTDTPDEDILGRINIYLADMNENIGTDCEAAYPGLFNYCRFKFEKRSKHIMRDPYIDSFQEESDIGSYKVVELTRGPIEAFGIRSKRIKHSESMGQAPFYVTHKNVLKGSISGDEERDYPWDIADIQDLKMPDHVYPGDENDFNQLMRCFQRALGDEDDEDEVDNDGNIDLAGDYDDNLGRYDDYSDPEQEWNL